MCVFNEDVRDQLVPRQCVGNLLVHQYNWVIYNSEQNYNYINFLFSLWYNTYT